MNLSETLAPPRMGRDVEYLRARFAKWEAAGPAGKRGRGRHDRTIGLEQRTHLVPGRHLEAAREAGRRAA